MPAATRTRRGLQIFSRRNAPRVDDTTMMSPPALDRPALDALPQFRAGGGSVTKLVFGDPDARGGGGLSLVWVRFAPHYHLPRHSHSVDCLYYIVSGAIRMGGRSLGPGEGFFVPADAPYGYVAGPDGVELLEFRATSSFDSRIRETPAGWSRILDAVRANQERWAAEVPTYQ
jgi:quercetin dioxygenase-like cupin family protein